MSGKALLSQILLVAVCHFSPPGDRRYRDNSVKHHFHGCRELNTSSTDRRAVRENSGASMNREYLQTKYELLMSFNSSPLGDIMKYFFYLLLCIYLVSTFVIDAVILHNVPGCSWTYWYKIRHQGNLIGLLQISGQYWWNAESNAKILNSGQTRVEMLP